MKAIKYLAAFFLVVSSVHAQQLVEYPVVRTLPTDMGLIVTQAMYAENSYELLVYQNLTAYSNSLPDYSLVEKKELTNDDMTITFGPQQPFASAIPTEGLLNTEDTPGGFYYLSYSIPDPLFQLKDGGFYVYVLKGKSITIPNETTGTIRTGLSRSSLQISTGSLSYDCFECSRILNLQAGGFFSIGEEGEWASASASEKQFLMDQFNQAFRTSYTVSDFDPVLTASSCDAFEETYTSGGLNFNGAGQYINFGSALQYQIEDNDFTLEAWAKLEPIGLDITTGFWPIYSKSTDCVITGGGGIPESWFFGILATSSVGTCLDLLGNTNPCPPESPGADGTSYQLFFSILDENAVGANVALSYYSVIPSVDFTSYHHVGFVKKGNNPKDWLMSFDGQQYPVVFSGDPNLNLEVQQTYLYEAFNNECILEGKLRVGADIFDNPCTSTNTLHARLQGLRVYRRALTSGELDLNFDAFAGPPSSESCLVLHAPLVVDAANEFRVQDVSSYANEANLLSSGYNSPVNWEVSTTTTFPKSFCINPPCVGDPIVEPEPGTYNLCAECD